MTIHSIEQYEIIRKSIKANINTIRVLVIQLDTLNGLVDGLEEDETKTKLDTNIKALYGTINQLIQDTNDLLDESVKFAKENIKVS